MSWSHSIPSIAAPALCKSSSQAVLYLALHQALQVIQEQVPIGSQPLLPFIQKQGRRDFSYMGVEPSDVPRKCHLPFRSPRALMTPGSATSSPETQGTEELQSLVMSLWTNSKCKMAIYSSNIIPTIISHCFSPGIKAAASFAIVASHVLPLWLQQAAPASLWDKHRPLPDSEAASLCINRKLVSPVGLA